MTTHLFNGFTRLGAFPLDSSSLFNSYEDAYNYAKNDPTAYYGQVIGVIDTEVEGYQGFYRTSLYTVSDINIGDGEVVIEKGLLAVGTGGGSGGGIAQIIINGKEVNKATGRIDIYAEDIQISKDDTRTMETLGDLIGFLTNYSPDDDHYEISKAVKSKKFTGITDIEDPTDAVSLGFLTDALDKTVETTSRNIQVKFDASGYNLYQYRLPKFKPGTKITGAKVVIEEEFSSDVDIEIFIKTLDRESGKYKTYTVFKRGTIFEREKGVYIGEVLIDIDEGPTILDIRFLDPETEEELDKEIDRGIGRLVLRYINYLPYTEE